MMLVGLFFFFGAYASTVQDCIHQKRHHRSSKETHETWLANNEHHTLQDAWKVSKMNTGSPQRYLERRSTQPDEGRNIQRHSNDDNVPRMFTKHNITVETVFYLQSQQREKRNRPITASPSPSAVAPWNILYREPLPRRKLNYTSTKIYAQVQGDAFLPCRVGHLGDRQVSWIRRRDWFVLTSGETLYTHDPRFVVLHEPGSQDWTLRIKRVMRSDAGYYECQVSTGTGSISFFVHIEVVTPTAEILGNKALHVNTGSRFILTCQVEKVSATMKHINWLHNGDQLNYKRESNGIIIETNFHKLTIGDDSFYENKYGEDAENAHGTVVSKVIVHEANDEHSGNYTCTAPNIKSDSAVIFVNEGDKTAAVQRIERNKSEKISWSLVVLCFSTCIHFADS